MLQDSRIVSWHLDETFYLIVSRCAHVPKVIFAKIRVKGITTVIERYLGHNFKYPIYLNKIPVRIFITRFRVKFGLPNCSRVLQNV